MNKLFLFILVFLTYAEISQAETIIVIGNLNAGVKISLEEIKKIYLENGVRIGNGTVVQPLDYHEGNELRDKFYEKLFDKNRSQIKSYWARKIFTGKGNPPLAFSSFKDARQFLLGSQLPMVMYMKETELEKSDTVLLKIP